MEKEKVNKEDFASFQRGLAQARAYLNEGAREGYVVHDPIDVRAIRERLELTRKAFAEVYGFDVRTVEQWEQGRRRPDRSTATYLRIINEHAEEIARYVSDLARHPDAGRQETLFA